ncbi:MAG: DUF2807 domain-containing protein [Vicingaceae bacterium]|nr:DUF2807 domain-containing protein [Vicingaceae bacterium]
MRLLKTYYFFNLLIIISIIASSCGKESSCFKGSGNDITEFRNITEEVTKIVLEDNIDLIITQGNIASLKIEAGENILPYINTDISDNELKISSDNKCGFLRNYKRAITAYLTLPNVMEVYYVGQGTVLSNNTITGSNFLFETRNGTGSVNLKVNVTDLSVLLHTGPSDITISGNSNSAYYYSGGLGWMYFNNLIANNVHVNNGGSGDIVLNATNKLLVELTSTGNIDYYGEPAITLSNTSGKGKLRKR